MLPTFIHQMVNFCPLCTHTRDGSNGDGAGYEAEAIIHADIKSGRPAEMTKVLINV